jgi:quercetin dioxygenase-like cupin family protein
MSDDHASGERPAVRLSRPIIELDVSAELAQIRDGAAYQASDHAAKTLIKEAGLDVLLLALKAGGHVREHRARVPILVQVLEGEVTFWVEDREFGLVPGRLLAVDANRPHRLAAKTEAAVLLILG